MAAIPDGLLASVDKVIGQAWTRQERGTMSKTNPKIPDLLADLRVTLESSRATMRKLRDVMSESNWELWTQWEETLMRMVACIDGAAEKK